MDADTDRAERLARQALMSSPRSARAHFSMGEVLRTQCRYTEAISEYEAALALNRNLVGALANIGRLKIYVGPLDDAMRALVSLIPMGCELPSNSRSTEMRLSSSPGSMRSSKP